MPAARSPGGRHCSPRTRMARSVAFVFERDLSARLEHIAFRSPVWIVDTAENRAAAEVVLIRAVDWPQISVTLFRNPESAMSRDDWRTLFRQVGRFDSAEVIGSALTLPARAAFTELGLDRIDESKGGFRASRRRH